MQVVTNLLWDYVLIFVLIGMGLTFTLVSRFVQFRYVGRMFAVLKRAFRHEAGHLSSFQALALSVAGRVGGGNIAGVAVAVSLGGPGAVFWMWLIGLLGMATSFFECSLGQLYKVARPDGSYRGGPAYYISRGLRQPWLAAVFSVLLLVTFGLAFNATQSFIVASSLEDAFGVPTWATGLGLVIVLGMIIFGGIKRIAAAAELLVPIMAIGYILVALVVVALHLPEVPAALGLIVRSGFGLEDAVSGGIGAAISFGVRRGLFSNEAGLGSAPNVAAVAYVKHPASQGIVQAFSVAVDTLVICTCTAFMIVLSDAYQPGMAAEGVTLTQAAMAGHVGEWGRGFVSIALLLFALTSMMYNYYLGETSLSFFREDNRVAFTGFRLLVLALVGWGSLQNLGTIFAFADLTMASLALVNLTALLLLFRVGLRVMRDFERQLAAGIVEPVLAISDYADLGIDPAAWADAAQSHDG